MCVWFTCRVGHGASVSDLIHGCGHWCKRCRCDPHRVSRPVCFYGHSMGALLSFELARELRRRNYTTPVRLFLSACRAPNVVRSVPSTFNLPVQEFMAKIEKLKGTPKEFFEFSRTAKCAFAFAASGLRDHRHLRISCRITPCLSHYRIRRRAGRTCHSEEFSSLGATDIGRIRHSTVFWGPLLHSKSEDRVCQDLRQDLLHTLSVP